MANSEWQMMSGHLPLAIRHSPIGAFLTAPGGLYDGPEDARLTRRWAPVKRRIPLPTLKSHDRRRRKPPAARSLSCHASRQQGDGLADRPVRAGAAGGPAVSVVDGVRAPVAGARSAPVR